MYLFARTSKAKPERFMDAMAFAADISAQVATITGNEVRAWSALYGDGLNTITWTARAESHAEMGAHGDKLLADAGYLARFAEAAELFDGAPEDTFSDVIATIGDGVQDAQFASVVTAQCGPGKIAEAMGWGVDIFNHVGKLTGRDGLLARGMYGPWATMAWISLASTLEEVDAANAAMNSDPGYIEMIDQGGSLFQPGSGQSRLTRRIA